MIQFYNLKQDLSNISVSSSSTLTEGHTKSATPLPGSISICRALPFLEATKPTDSSEGSVTGSISINLISKDPVRFKLKTKTSTIHPSIVIAQ